MCVDVTANITRASGDNTIIYVRCRSKNKIKISTSSSTKNMYNRTSSSIIRLASFINYLICLLDLYSSRDNESSPLTSTTTYIPLYFICYSLWKFHPGYIYGSSKTKIFLLKNDVIVIIRVFMNNHRRKKIQMLVFTIV
jgi:hypothetical protein